MADKAEPDSPHTIGTAGNEAWSHGKWKVTLQAQDDKPFELTGNWTEIYRREGDTWNIAITPVASSVGSRNELDRLSQTVLMPGQLIGLGRFPVGFP